MASSGIVATLTKGLTSSLGGAIKYFGGKTLEQLIAALSPTAWYDASETYAKSKIAVDFDGTADTLNGDSKLVTSTTFSAIACVNADTTTSFQRIHAEEGAAGQRSWRVSINASANAVFNTSHDGTNYDTATHGSTLSTGSWYWVVARYDSSLTGSELSIRVYDSSGSEVGTEVTNSHTSAIFNGTNPYSVGSNGDGGSWFDGKIDQTIVLNNDYLSDSEISEIINSGNGLQWKDLTGSETFYNNIVAWYDFNIPTNFGRNYAEASHAVDCTGAGDQLNVPSPLYLSIENAWSVGGWVYMSSGTGNRYFLFQGAAFGFIQIYRAADGAVSFWLYNSGDTTRAYVQFNDLTNINEWVHLAFTYDGSGVVAGIKGYANGVELTNRTTTDTLSISTGTATSGYLMGGTFGKIDEAFWYQDVLTAGEVTTLYNGGTVAEASTLHTDNLVSSWSFDEQSVSLLGQDKYGTNDLTPVSIVEADLVGGKDSLDLTEVSISSSNAVLGHIEGKSAPFDGVTRWTDRSTNGNNMTQSTLADVPTWIEDIGGLVSFTGNQSTVTDATIDLTGSHSIFMLWRVADITDTQDLVASNGLKVFRLHTGGVLRNNGFTNITNANTGMVNNVYAYNGYRYNSTSQNFEFFFNGASDGTSNAGAPTFTAGTIEWSYLNHSSPYEFAQILIFTKELSDTEVATVSNYLQSIKDALEA